MVLFGVARADIERERVRNIVVSGESVLRVDVLNSRRRQS
jgi:hypothetical protein